MKKINLPKAIFVLMIASWLGLFGADQVFGLSFDMAGAVGAGLIYTALLAGIAWLAQSPAKTEI